MRGPDNQEKDILTFAPFMCFNLNHSSVFNLDTFHSSRTFFCPIDGNPCCYCCSSSSSSRCLSLLLLLLQLLLLEELKEGPCGVLPFAEEGGGLVNACPR